MHRDSFFRDNVSLILTMYAHRVVSMPYTTCITLGRRRYHGVACALLGIYSKADRHNFVLTFK